MAVKFLDGLLFNLNDLIMGFLDTLGNVLTGTPLLGSLVSAGASLIGGNQQVKAQEEANRQNYKLFKEQLGFTEDMWNKTNEYNTPVNQRARFEAAGINPYFALGQINGGNATAQVGSSGNPMIPADASGRAIANAGAALGNGIAQLVPQFQQVLSNRENIRALQVENAFRASRLQNDLVHQVRENDEILSRTNLTDEQRSFYSKQNDELRERIVQLQEYNKYVDRRARADTERAEFETDSLYLQNQYQRMVNRAFPALNAAQQQALSAQASASFAAAMASKENAHLSKEQAKRVAIQCLGDSIENGIKAHDFDLKAFQLNSAELESMRKRGTLTVRENSPLFTALDNAASWIVDTTLGRLFK